MSCRRTRANRFPPPHWKSFKLTPESINATTVPHEILQVHFPHKIRYKWEKLRQNRFNCGGRKTWMTCPNSIKDTIASFWRKCLPFLLPNPIWGSSHAPLLFLVLTVIMSGRLTTTPTHHPHPTTHTQMWQQIVTYWSPCSWIRDRIEQTGGFHPTPQFCGEHIWHQWWPTAPPKWSELDLFGIPKAHSAGSGPEKLQRDPCSSIVSKYSQ